MNATASVTVRVPAKVNLQLAVGPARGDGYHGLVNVFHAVSLFDEVTVSVRGDLPPGQAVLSADGERADHVARVPLDGSNLAARAAALLARHVPGATGVHIHLAKAIPVAGGMAGGSADAAAALVACDTLWGGGTPRERLLELAADLGSDVPFPLLGHTAVGTGRGERLAPLPVRGTFHWVFALAEGGLSTAAVFAEYDRLRPDAPEPRLDPELAAALAAGDPRRLGAALANDLQPAALSLRPALGEVLDVGRAAGALGAVVSGSGPTCAFLAESAEHARALAEALRDCKECADAVTAHGPVPGAVVR
ncbi:4-(cytidine 5'-diphospho)-2-C-methyl-D-erythritol kinase [Thermobifida cellulosilytica]|uniref:4-diphosphocytidyl-2-C-methyl-D-erythritol kinase n=1 Tax=Thermobifida cellulosilytica TB100 TaxID=665004 RepID=A0A147KJS7_THECS|nr:4-(cytidine 5'-diphospho)-2-C-methyl-D-erythritol kinase [Thermobifida cellulosilytica]KUP97574.1 4-diphosphocytidyl-2C-methyl-D-erythritol kinase [Thermobifida cellulosilytica TB100]